MSNEILCDAHRICRTIHVEIIAAIRTTIYLLFCVIVVVALSSSSMSLPSTTTTTTMMLRSNWHLFMWDGDKFMFGKRNPKKNNQQIATVSKTEQQNTEAETHVANIIHFPCWIMEPISVWTGILENLSYDGSTFECAIFQTWWTD